MDVKNMTIEELRALLREDCLGVAQLPEERLMEIMAKLVRRCPPSRSAEEALQEFHEHYLP